MSYNQQKIQKIIENKKKQQDITKQNRQLEQAKRQAEEQAKRQVEQATKPEPKKVNPKPTKKCKYADKEVDDDLFSAYSKPL